MNEISYEVLCMAMPGEKFRYRVNNDYLLKRCIFIEHVKNNRQDYIVFRIDEYANGMWRKIRLDRSQVTLDSFLHSWSSADTNFSKMTVVAALSYEDVFDQNKWEKLGTDRYRILQVIKEPVNCAGIEEIGIVETTNYLDLIPIRFHKGKCKLNNVYKLVNGVGELMIVDTIYKVQYIPREILTPEEMLRKINGNSI